MHFDAWSQPLVYFKVLCLTQQFEAAIAFLARFEAFRCHAVHIALALRNRNVLLISNTLQAPLGRWGVGGETVGVHYWSPMDLVRIEKVRPSYPPFNSQLLYPMKRSLAPRCVLPHVLVDCITLLPFLP